MPHSDNVGTLATCHSHSRSQQERLGRRSHCSGSSRCRLFWAVGQCIGHDARRRVYGGWAGKPFFGVTYTVFFAVSVELRPGRNAAKTQSDCGAGARCACDEHHFGRAARDSNTGRGGCRQTNKA